MGRLWLYIHDEVQSVFYGELLFEPDKRFRDLLILFAYIISVTIVFYIFIAWYCDDLSGLDKTDLYDLAKPTLVIAIVAWGVIAYIDNIRERRLLRRANIDILDQIQQVQQSPVSETLQNSVQRKIAPDNLTYFNNQHNPLIIEYLEIDNHLMFDELKWRMAPQMNVLLGKNGYGKTFVLKLLAAFLANDSARINEFSGTRAEIKIGVLPHPVRAIYQSTSAQIISLENGAVNTMAPIPVLAIPDIRVVSRSANGISPPNIDEDLGRHGCDNFISDTPIDNFVQRTLYQACSELLLLPAKSSPSGVPLFALMEKIIKTLTGTAFIFDKVELAPTGGRYRVEVITEAQPTPVPLQVVSQGTLSVIAIFGLIYDFLKTVALPDGLGAVENTPGIVIIDEIDAHLHPSWQRCILDLLRQTFPNVQFIVTAHSPLVVAGCLEDEVSVLRRNEREKLEIKNLENDFVGWSPDKILREVFKIEGLDIVFSRYSAMAYRLPAMQADAEKLLAKEKRSGEEEARLEKLQRDIGYIEKTQRLQNDERDTERLRARNAQLQHRIAELT